MFLYAVIEASTLMIGISKKKGQTFFALFVSPSSKIFHFHFSDLTEGVHVSQGNASTLAFLSKIVHVQINVTIIT